MYLKWSFLLLPTCIKRTLSIKFHHPTCQTPEMWKIATNCHPQIFDFYIKKHVFTNLFAKFHSKVLFSISFCLYGACFTHLISSNLSYITIYVYGTTINLSTLIKKLMQMYIVIVSGSFPNISNVHLNGIWYLIWCYLHVLKPVLDGHPVLSRDYSIP